MSEWVLARPLFTVGDRAFCWADAVCAAKEWGEWARLEQAACEQVAALDRAARVGVALTGREFDWEEERFRRGLGLLAAAELESWLAARAVELRGWRDFVRGEVLRARRATNRGPPSALDAPDPLAEAAIDAVLWAQAMCSGVMDDVAQRLARRAAVTAAAGGMADADGLLTASELSQFDRCFEAFGERSANDAALDREIERRSLDWLTVGWRYQASGDEEVVREAALCIREDGMGFDEVAAVAGLAVRRRRSVLETVEPELRAQLLGGQVGVVLGPLTVASEHWLVEVLDRRTPSRGDPDVVERARAAVIERAVETEAVNRVRWHEQLRQR